MFRRTDPNGNSVSSKSKGIDSEPLAVAKATMHTKPRIFLADMSDEWGAAIQGAGYEVARGTFGTPITAAKSNKEVVVPLNHHLPEFAEQEIVFVNLSSPAPKDGKPAPGIDGVMQWHQRCPEGVLDPRPLIMHTVCNDVFRISEHGGMFVVTATAEWPSNYLLGDRDNGFRHELDLSPWSLLSKIVTLEVHNESGSEIVFEANGLAQFLKRGAQGAQYSCVFSPSDDNKNWLSLAKNKYGRDVAGLLVRGNKPRSVILLLPHMPKLHLLAKELLEDWIARWNPSLFPHLEGQSWVHRPEYELPKVTDLLQQIEVVEKTAEERCIVLQAEIDETRAENPHWYSLLRATGDELATAVMAAFRKLGFTKVIDVDAEAKSKDQKAQLREDIQVHDRSPVLIIDVKGIGGHPADDEATQANKHATMRRREWNRKDVQPLTVINSQRHIPPADREPKAFRDEIIQNARQDKLGLITTWDMFNILRNADLHKWPLRATQDIFYQTGRVDPVPSHYAELGTIVKTWEHSFSIVPSSRIAVGDILAVQVGDGFEQFSVASLQVDKKAVAIAEPERSTGVGCDRARERFREGCRVFKVNVESE